MQRIHSEMSVPSQRKVLVRAQELVRTPEFRDGPAPTPEEVRRPGGNPDGTMAPVHDPPSPCLGRPRA